MNFKQINDSILIHSNGVNYYKSLQTKSDLLSGAEERGISSIIHAIINKLDISEELVTLENNLTNKIRVNEPGLFDNVVRETDLLYNSLNYVISHYNKAINEKENVLIEFQKIEAIANAKGVKYASVFDQIGKNLVKGISPTVKQIYYASNIISDRSIKELKVVNNKIDVDKIEIDSVLMRKMYEWDSTAKILSTKERAYVADFAWGLKILNSFHEKNVRRHLESLLKRGFQV